MTGRETINNFLNVAPITVISTAGFYERECQLNVPIVGMIINIQPGGDLITEVSGQNLSLRLIQKAFILSSLFELHLIQSGTSGHVIRMQAILSQH